MSSSQESALDVIASVLKSGLKEVADYAREHHWRLRNMQVVQHRMWGDGPPSAWYQDELVVDYGAIGRCAEHLRQTCSTDIESCIASDENVLAHFATSDYGVDVDRTIRIAAAADSLIDDFAVQYLFDLQNFDWNEAAFAGVIEAVRNFLELRSHSLIVRAPLQNFLMNADELILAEGICIKRLQEADASKLEVSSLYGRQNRSVTPFQWMPENYIIEMMVEVAIGADRYEERRKAVLRLHECLTAIRLMNDGSVSLGDIWIERISPNFGDSYDDVYVLDERPGIRPRVELVVDATTSSIIAELISSLTGVWALGAKKSNPLFIPNSRFNMYFERTFVEDQFLDLAICLEALFTKSGETSELTDKISRRIGRLLGSTQEARIEMIRTAKKLYGVRSRLVHGEPVEAQTLFDSVHILLRIVRESIILKIRTDWTVESLEREMML